MKNVDLASYNLGELKGLQHEIGIAIKERQQQEVQKAREQILGIAKDAGVSVEELLSTLGKKTKKGTGKKVPPKYQNPENASQTWTGRGRQPSWIAEALSSGKELDDLRMN